MTREGRLEKRTGHVRVAEAGVHTDCIHVVEEGQTEDRIDYILEGDRKEGRIDCIPEEGRRGGRIDYYILEEVVVMTTAEVEADYIHLLHRIPGHDSSPTFSQIEDGEINITSW